MKTFKILTAAVLLSISANAFADGKIDSLKLENENSSTALISSPRMVWGNPEDVNSKSIEKLKTSPYLMFDAPEMNWGTPEDLNPKSIENLKNAARVPAPEMIWGSPVDVHFFHLSK